MHISETESKILLKIYDICFVTLDDEISIGLLYDLTSKNYLWKSIKEMESKHIIWSYMDGRKKFVRLTPIGKRIVKALIIIRNI
jgi:hypothetical protein